MGAFAAYCDSRRRGFVLRLREFNSAGWGACIVRASGSGTDELLRKLVCKSLSGNPRDEFPRHSDVVQRRRFGGDLADDPNLLNAERRCRRRIRAGDPNQQTGRHNPSNGFPESVRGTRLGWRSAGDRSKLRTERRLRLPPFRALDGRSGRFESLQ